MKVTMQRCNFELRCPFKPGLYRFEEGDFGKNKSWAAMLTSWASTEKLYVSLGLETKQGEFIFSEEAEKFLKEII